MLGHADRDQMQLYIYFYGSASLSHEWNSVVGADATPYTEQACVCNMKQHQLLVQRECPRVLRGSIQQLVGERLWSTASTNKRVDFIGACFDLAPVRVCREIYPKLGKIVDFATIFFTELDDMTHWRSFTRYRFVCMWEAIFVREMMNPADDVRFLLYGIRRDLPNDSEIAPLKEALGNVARLPSSPFGGRPGDKRDTVIIEYEKPAAAKRYAPTPIVAGGGGLASAGPPRADVE